MADLVLEVRELSVSAGGHPVLHEVSLEVRPGETHVLLGPNGSGKTTLLLAIMGMPGYDVTGGAIRFRGEEVSGLGPDERARRGIALSFQKPPAVRGVTLRAVAEHAVGTRGGAAGAVAELAEGLRAGELLERDLNVGLSGGETKRSELLQLLALGPELALFDEPESGVDLDSVAVVGAGMRRLLGREGGGPPKAALVVTHTGHILQELPADRGHVLIRGRIVCRGEPRALFEDVRRHGYEGCLTCTRCRNG